MTEVKIHAYADNEQLHDSDSDPLLLDRQLTYQLVIANKLPKQWHACKSHQAPGHDNRIHRS